MTRWLDIADNAISAYKAQQLKQELAVFLAYLDSIQPRHVLEIGSADGGLAWAIVQIESVQRLVTIDKNTTPGAKDVESLFPSRIIPIIGNSTDPAVVHAAHAEGDYDVVIIDGGHDWPIVSSDWNNYAKMAKPGGLVMVHDTQGYHNYQNFDVPELWGRVRRRLHNVELISWRGMEAGIGLVWAGEGKWWDVL